jgi:hypothetical protein
VIAFGRDVQYAEPQSLPVESKQVHHLQRA